MGNTLPSGMVNGSSCRTMYEGGLKASFSGEMWLIQVVPEEE